MKRIQGLLACAGLILLSACSTVSDAQKLSTVGVEASARAKASSSAVYDAFVEGPRLDSLIQAYSTNGEQPITHMPPATFNKIKDALEARVELATSLADFYVSFGKLAGSDEQTNVDTSLSGVFDGASSFGVAMGKGALPPYVGSIAGEVGGLLASAVQRGEVLKANDELIVALNYYHEALIDPNAREAIISLTDDAIGYRFKLLSLLWKQGMLSGDPSISGVIAASGVPFKLAARPEDLTVKSRAFNAVVQDELAQAQSDQLAAVADDYDSTVKLVEELLKQHKALKSETKVDMAGVAALAKRLKTIADLLKKDTPSKTGS